MIQEFEQILLNCSSVYSTRFKKNFPMTFLNFFFNEIDYETFFSKTDVKNSSAKQPFTLMQHLEDQKEVLHGYEARALRYIPKVKIIT